jgi:hypothetical protein
MGVEPTMASSSLPINGFEDRGDHRAPTTPTTIIIQPLVVMVKGAQPHRVAWNEPPQNAALESLKYGRADASQR